MGSTKSGSAEGLGGGSGQKESAQAKPDKQPPETVQVSEAVHVMHESLPAARPSEHLSKAAASSRSSSLSPQPSKHLHDGRSPGQQALAPSSWAAPAAQQVQPLAAEEEEPWQEVSRARRKAVRQQTTTKNGVPGGPMQGRVVPDQAAAPQSPPRLRRLQAGAQHEAQALANPRTAVLPFPAQPAGDVTEQLPFLLQTLAGTHLGMQHEPVQATASLTPQDEEDCSAPQQMLYPWVHSQSSSSEQVSMLAWKAETRLFVSANHASDGVVILSEGLDAVQEHPVLFWHSQCVALSTKHPGEIAKIRKVLSCGCRLPKLEMRRT